MADYTIRAISRAIELLKCFSLKQTELSLNEMSEMVGLSKSTIHRIVKTLEEEEMLIKNPFKETYSLGMVVFQLGNIVRSSLELRDIAMPIMRELAIESGESTFLSVLSGTQKVCIEKIDSIHGLRPTIKTGQVSPAHVGSSGKALLAYLGQEEVEVLIAQSGLPAFTEKTITDKNILERELALVRERGFAYGFEERTVGGAGVSAPIWGYSGKVIAALSVVGPAEGIKSAGVEKLAAMVVEAAKKISDRLGNYRTSS